MTRQDRPGEHERPEFDLPAFIVGGPEVIPSNALDAFAVQLHDLYDRGLRIVEDPETGEPNIDPESITAEMLADDVISDMSYFIGYADALETLIPRHPTNQTTWGMRGWQRMLEMRGSED